MISISLPTIINLDFQKNIELSNDIERRKFALNESSFRINSTRLGDIRIEITVLEGTRPNGLFIYYFQQSTRSQVEPFDLSFNNENTISIEVQEPDFWKHNPLYVDRIGIMGRGVVNGKCKLQVEVFKIFG